MTEFAMLQQPLQAGVVCVQLEGLVKGVLPLCLSARAPSPAVPAGGAVPVLRMGQFARLNVTGRNVPAKSSCSRMAYVASSKVSESRCIGRLS